MSSCSVAPGSPVFSPSRHLLKPADLPATTFLPASPLRPVSLRVHYRPDPSPASNSALKRRRPAPLLIVPPEVSITAPPAAHGGMDEVAEHGKGFAAYCRRGKGRRRLEMEDRHVAAVGLGLAVFGVFDGHGGKGAAEFAAGNMPRIIAEELGGRVEEEEAVRRAYLRTDDEFSRGAGAGGGGACCVTAVVREGRLVVSGAGDCRAVLSRGGKAEALTDDHRASRRDERDRIEALRGGVVLNCRGTWRVQGSLAVTRGIGDAHLKPWVVPEPETTTVAVDEDCELLVLASDGLWDKVGNQEAVDAARASSGDLPAACRRIVEMAASRGTTDDVSVLVIDLHRFL